MQMMHQRKYHAGGKTLDYGKCSALLCLVVVITPDRCATTGSNFIFLDESQFSLNTISSSDIWQMSWIFPPPVPPAVIY